VKKALVLNKKSLLYYI